jgi:ribosomal protein S18 acetylase RimI-like enzyme
MNYEFVEEGKSKICEKILRSLPGWFGIESAILDYTDDVRAMPMLVAYDGAEVVGFLSLNLHNKFTAEVHVMGVLPTHHRRGIGRKLIQQAEECLKKRDFVFLTVKTLSESRPNKEYDQTRSFYYSTGFLPVEEFKTLWGEHNPCLLMIRSLT